MRQQFILVLFTAYAALVGVLSLQAPGGVSVGSYDKAAHWFTYAVFAFLAFGLKLSHRYFIILCLGIVVYSGLLEFGQSFVPGRDMSLLDLLANLLGVITGALLCTKLLVARRH